MKRSTVVGMIVVVIIAGVFLGMQKNDNAAAGDNPASIANFAFSPKSSTFTWATL